MVPKLQTIHRSSFYGFDHRAHNEDKVLQELSKAVKKGVISKKNQPQIHETYNKILQEITISDAGLLLRGEKIILPSSLIERAIKKAHQGSHPGMSCMK